MDQLNDTEIIETEEQADALLEQIAPEGPTAPETQEPAQAAAQAPADEWDLTVGGKQIKAKRDQVMQWAQMGYSAPARIEKLSKELNDWKQKESHYKSLDEKYGPVDKFVREKPDFWDHVLKSYEQRNQLLQDQSNPLASMVQQLQTQVQDLVQYKQQIEQRQQEERVQHEDTEYMSTLQSIQKDYPDIDFVTPDVEGKSLEYKVLEHANANGIKNFKTAFRDFYHDELLKRSESKAKESLVKEKQKQTKLGILGTSQTPTKHAPQRSVRESSYDDLAAEALAELGIR